MIRIAETIQTDVLWWVLAAQDSELPWRLKPRSARCWLPRASWAAAVPPVLKLPRLQGITPRDGCIGSDSPAHHYQDIIDAALGTCDPELARILAEEAPWSLVELESWGVPFEKKDGHHLVVEGCFASRPRMHIIKRHSVPILEVLTERLRAADVNVLEEVMVVDLLTQDGACVGALLIDTAGRYLLVEASAVILACGGAGQLFERNLNPSDITGTAMP